MGQAGVFPTIYSYGAKMAGQLAGTDLGNTQVQCDAQKSFSLCRNKF